MTVPDLQNQIQTKPVCLFFFFLKTYMYSCVLTGKKSVELVKQKRFVRTKLVSFQNIFFSLNLGSYLKILCLTGSACYCMVRHECSIDLLCTLAGKQMSKLPEMLKHF